MATMDPDGNDSSFGLINSALLEKIDRLFACGVGDYINLPQLVVVGDQSSGKSSVLEGLTALPFPRDSGLCTRFPTQITFRRSEEASISVSIIPARNSDDSRRDRLKEWSKANIASFNASTFSDIMTEVKEVMSIGAGPDGQRTFSEDVLRLEISGPTQGHFSVIDVPGIFKRTTAGLTTKEDRELVDEMVHGYMSNPRSVMLTVIPCNVDIATQEILERAEEVDPEGIRTLGILTKPDLVDKGAEQAIVDLLEGKEHQLKLGWHLLRNPGQAELTNHGKSRSDIERDFFAKAAPWSRLPKDIVGIDPLRGRIQDILAEHTRREFPQVKAELTQKLRTAEKSLRDLGRKRQTEREQREYLIEIATDFQRTAEAAIQADYSGTDFFEKEEKLRLATQTMNRGQRFADLIGQHGHAYHFASEDDEKSFETDKLLAESEAFNVKNDASASLRSREEDSHQDLEDILVEDAGLELPSTQNILFWLRREYRSSRGFELGTFDPSLLAVTLKRQATKWRDLVLGYVSDVVTLVHVFITRCLEYITSSVRVRQGILSILMGGLLERYRNAVAHAGFLLEVELEGTPATYNHYFNDQLEKRRQNRLQTSLKKRAFSDCKHGTVVRLEDIAAGHPLSNPDHTVMELHDILGSYYKVARKRVVDNVRMQVADRFLVNGPDTPLKLLSASFVTSLTSEQLEEIAGEDMTVKRRRNELEQKIKQLEEGKKIVG